MAADSSSSNESESEPVVVPVVRGRGRGRGCGRVRGRARLAQNAVDDTAAIVAGDEASQEMEAKSGRLWSKVAPAVHRRGLQDIIRTPSGIRHEAHAEMNAFKLPITPEMLDVIARETNREAERKVAAWNKANPHNIQEWNATSITEIQAVIGLVILAGIHRGRLEPLEALWSARSGRPIFTAVTSLKRFKSLLRYLSFDNKATRETRRATDKLAAVIL